MEVTGLINSMKAALAQVDRDETHAEQDITSYIEYLNGIRVITDSEDRPGLLVDERERLLENYRADRTHTAFEKRRIAIRASYASYAKQKGWKF